MKLLITFLLTTLITLPVRSQDKIEGIGKFKIGKSSIDITNQIATEFLTDIKLISNMSEQYKSYRPSIVELETNRDNSPDRPRRAPHCEKLRGFYINKYKVADIEIESIYLTFKDDILIEFLTEKPRSILTPIAQKYGEAKTAIRYDSSYCWYDGKKEVRTNVHYLSQWLNGDIHTTNVEAYIYDKECRRRPTIYFNVYSEKALKEANVCENQVKASFDKAREDAEKKKLKDF